MADRDTRGRRERAAEQRARLKRPDLRSFYRGHVAKDDPGNYEFTLDLLRGRGLKNVPLDDRWEDFGWADQEATLVGDVILRRGDPKTFPVANGHQIRCRVRARGTTRWYELWTMRVQPDLETDPVGATVQVQLKDDLDKANRGKRKWKYRKTKARGRGWRADEIVRHAARREHIRIGRLAKGTKRQKKLEVEGTFLELVKQAYAKEKDHSGRKFIIRMRNGRLEVVPYRRNRLLHAVEEQITAAMLHQEQKGNPVTVIEARGKVHGKKVKMTVANRAVVRRFGRITKEKDYGKVDSRTEMKQLATRELAAEVRVKRTADLTIPGVPFIRRGDGMRWVNREPGWYGATASVPKPEFIGSRDRTFVFVSSISHRVGTSYSTDLTVEQEDPFVKDRNARDKERREKARQKRKQRTRKQAA